MDYKDLDEAEYERRKKDQIAWRTKKSASNKFMFLLTLAELAGILLSMAILFLLASFIMFKCFDNEGKFIQVAFPIVVNVIFFGGIILGFVFSKRIGRWAIAKFNLEEKLLDEVLQHYKYEKTKKPENEE